MPSVAVDANVVIAARRSRDQNHRRGRDIVQAIDAGDLPTGLVLRDVLEEVVNYLQARDGHDAALDTLDAIVESRGFDVVHTTKRDFDAGRATFRTYDRLSLTDAVIAATMHRKDVEYLYSFDDGFDGIDGITRLTTPENPFE